MEEWRDDEITGWPVEHQEMRGKRPKYWVRDPVSGALWLRKEPRPRGATEPAIEALVLRLARAVGLAAPDSRACTWRVAPPATVVKRGIVVRLFTEPPEDLSLGSVELSAADPGGYDPERRCLHTLARVRAALTTIQKSSLQPMLEPFAQMLAFDAWIGNSDRHQENWGVLRNGGVVSRLAPVFDPAACLGVELDPSNGVVRPGADLGPYIARCPSGFGDGSHEKPLLPMARVVEATREWPEWKAGISGWLAAFGAAMDTFEQVATRVPADWLPPERAVFACKLLRTRLEWLRERSGA